MKKYLRSYLEASNKRKGAVSDYMDYNFSKLERTDFRGIKYD